MGIDVVLTRSNPVDPDPRVEKTARCLKNAGYKYLILGWRREISEKSRQHKQLNIKRMAFPGKYGGGIANLLGLLVFNIWLFFNHLIIRPKIIHSFDLDTVLPALVAKLLLKNKIVYDITDWFADSRKVGFLKPFVVKLERWVCSKVDVVILPHEERLHQLGFKPRKLVVVYNTPEDILKNENLCNNTNKTIEPTFSYVGVLQPDRGIEQMIEAAQKAKVKLLIAGFGPLAELCRQSANLYENINFLGRVSYHKALTIEKQSTAIIALYDPSIDNNRLAAPNKLYEAMMLQRPIITTKNTLVGRIVENNEIGVTVPYGDVESLVKTLIFIKNNPTICEQMGIRGRMLYEKYYSYQAQCRTLTALYNTLTSN